MPAPPAPSATLLGATASLSPAELRRLALEAIAGDDARVTDALRTAHIWIRHAAATWESSEGTTLGHLVGLALDAELFARIAPEPPLVDTLTVAIAGAIALRPHESLRELRIHWNGTVRSAGHYRGDALHVGLANALESYLTERGEHTAARHAHSANMRITSRATEIVVAIGSLPEGMHFEHDFRAMAEALTFLLSGPDAVHVRVIR